MEEKPPWGTPTWVFEIAAIVASVLLVVAVLLGASNEMLQSFVGLALVAWICVAYRRLARN